MSINTKNDSIGLPESDFLSDSTQKPSTPCDSAALVRQTV